MAKPPTKSDITAGKTPPPQGKEAPDLSIVDKTEQNTTTTGQRGKEITDIY